MSEREPPAPPSAADPAEAALFFRMSSERMRKRARWAAIALLLTALVPFDFIGPAPLFLWDGLGEVPLGHGLALLALPLAGLAILVASFVARRPSTLAIFVFAAILGATGIREFGPERLGWRDFALPESVAHRPGLALIAIALTAAGANLSHRSTTRRLSRFVLGGAAAAALLFLVSPTRGITPIGTVFRVLGTLPALDGVRYQIALVLIALVVLWPFITASLGLLFIRRPATKSDPWIVLLATFFPPILLGMFIAPTSLFSVSAPGEKTVNVARGMTYLTSTFVVAVVVSALAAACVVLSEAQSLPEGTEEAAAEIGSDLGALEDDAPKPKPRKPGLAPKLAGAIAGGALVVLWAVAWILARPSRPNLDWTVRARTPEGDLAFGRALERWSSVRNQWENQIQEGANAMLASETRSAAKELVAAAKDVSPDLGRAVQAMTEGSEGLDLGGRKWTRLIGAVNEASRQGSLPYYVEPEIWIYAQRTSDIGDDYRLVRNFTASGFAIESISRFDVGGRSFATAHVHTLLGDRLAHDRAGFVGEVQPFGLVVLDELDGEYARLRDSAMSGGCTRSVVARTRDSQKALRACATHLSAFVEDDGDTLRDALIAVTERHELQHQIDGPGLNLAKPIQKRLNMFPPSFQDRANRELSAFLGEMTAEGTAPRLAVLRLVPWAFAFSRDDMTSFYHASTIALEGLTGLVLHKGSAVDGWVEFDRLEDAIDKLMSMSDDALRKKAAETYDELFGESLPKVEPAK
ncbi:MAG: hypothetical protein U0414_32765 [Polyangiaceae bacterium]